MDCPRGSALLRTRRTAKMRHALRMLHGVRDSDGSATRDPQERKSIARPAASTTVSRSWTHVSKFTSGTYRPWRISRSPNEGRRSRTVPRRSRRPLPAGSGSRSWAMSRAMSAKASRKGGAWVVAPLLLPPTAPVLLPPPPAAATPPVAPVDHPSHTRALLSPRVAEEHPPRLLADDVLREARHLAR